MTVYGPGFTPTAAEAAVQTGTTSPTPATGTDYFYAGTNDATAYQRLTTDGQALWAFARLIYLSTATAVDLDLFATRISSDTANGFLVRSQGTGLLRMVANGGAFPWTSTAAIPTAGWYLLRGYGDGVNGQARACLSNLDGSIISGMDSGLITCAQGGVAPSGIREGKLSAATGYTGRNAWGKGTGGTIFRTGTDASQTTLIAPYGGATAVSGDAYPTGAASGGYTRVGTATTDGGALADSDDTTYLESAALSTTVQTLRIAVQPMTTRTGLSVTFRLRLSGSGTCTATPRLMQGTTSKGALSAITVTTSFADYVLTLTSAQIAAITDWTNLYVEIDATT